MEYPTYLIHYGIPGQKWGNRRWQYEDGSLTPEGYIHYGYGKRESTKQKIDYLSFKERAKSGKLTDKDIRNLNGSNNIRDFDSQYTNYGYQLINSNSLGLGSIKLNDILTNADTNTIDNIPSVNAAYALKKSQPLNLDDELVMKSVTRRINPNYGEKGTTNNCLRCTTALTLAKMGYSTPNGISAGRALYGASSSGFSYWFDGAEMKTVDTINDAENELKSQPKGSFGEFAISRYDANGNRTGGHSMAYSILNDGSIRIEEGQAGQVFHSIEDAMKNCGASEKQIMITRLDNTRPNIKHIAEDSLIDIGGKRDDKSTYVVKQITNAKYRDEDFKVTNYSWKNSGRAVNYDEVGKDDTGHVSGLKTGRDIIYDEHGHMKVNTIGDYGEYLEKNQFMSRLNSLVSSGKTQDEISNILGVSISTLNRYL